jgi:tellurite resistance protein TerC
MKARRAALWVALWVTVAMAATYGIFKSFGTKHGMEFLTCYIIEWTLSVDNLFVFLLIFKSFGVSSHRQLRVLNWGIIGAVILRLLFILVGVALVQMFEPILYLFGAILIYSAYKMVAQKDEFIDIKEHPIVKYAARHIPMTNDYEGSKFFIKRGKGFISTPMILVLVAVNLSDIIFAVDSVPAAFAITRNPWIIFSANVFAILGLRSLYFVLAQAEEKFWLLKYGVGVVLAFVGVKMLTANWIEYDRYLSLAIILISLGAAMAASILIPPPKTTTEEVK